MQVCEAREEDRVRVVKSNDQEAATIKEGGALMPNDFFFLPHNHNRYRLSYLLIELYKSLHEVLVFASVKRLNEFGSMWKAGHKSGNLGAINNKIFKLCS